MIYGENEMRREGNTIILDKNESMLSGDKDEWYWLVAGDVQVFVVEWFNADATIDRQAGRAARLVEMRAGDEDLIGIPSLCYQELNDGRNWRLSIKATDRETKLEIRDHVTQQLKKRFLKKCEIFSYEAEGGQNRGGYENSLIAHYHANQLKESVLVYGGNKNKQETQERVIHTVTSGMNSEKDSIPEKGSLLYKAVAYAAQKCGAGRIEDEEKIVAACEESEITVQEIARAAHLVCREITLDIDWYQSDCGVVIAMLSEETKKGQKSYHELRPIVCYQKGNRYYYYDFAAQKEHKLKKEQADRFEPKAYSIRRTLPNKKLNRKDIVSFVRKSIKGWDIAYLTALSALCTVIGVLLPKLNQLIYDEYIPMGDRDLLKQICFVIAACMIGKVFISIAKTIQEYRVPARAGYEMQDAVYQRIFELPETFFRNFDSAELANRVAGVSGIVNLLLTKVLTNGFTLVLSLFYWFQMYRYSGRLTGYCFIMLLVFGILVYLLSLRSIKYIRQIEESKGKADGKLFQIIAGVDKIRLAGAEERAVLEYSTPVANEKRVSLSSGRNGAIISVLLDASSTVFSMILYWIMINSKTKVDISMGSFIAFTTAFGSVSAAVLGFVQGLTDYAQMKPLIERVNPVFETAPEDNREKEIITEVMGKITVDHVTFGYSKEQAPIINDVSIEIQPGEYVAIVGPSGSGKSTLLKLLLGFETPDQGRVLYDGKDISSVNKHSLRKNVGVVLQNGKLISGSILDNITITAPRIDINKVWETIDDVGLREDIEAMPMGFHTVIAEDGGTISGGQQQRILIARAIYRNPKVLFFDEATSALDNLTQAKVCESLEKRQMTRVVIAHRLSTVRKCNRILVLDHGNVVEEGNYEELMRQKGRFYEMAIRQIV